MGPRRLLGPASVLGPYRVLGPHKVLGPHRVLGLHRVLRPHESLGPHKVLGLHRILGPRSCQGPGSRFPVCPIYTSSTVLCKNMLSEMFCIFQKTNSFQKKIVIIKKDSYEIFSNMYKCSLR